MMKRPVTIMVSAELAKLLDQVAAANFYRRSTLAEKVLEEWLAGPRKIPGQDNAIERLPASVQRQAMQRREILESWHCERRKRRQTEAAATAALLARLERFQDIRITRGTLYNWARRYRQHGLAGLVDGRSNLLFERTSKGERRGYKAGAKPARVA